MKLHFPHGEHKDVMLQTRTYKIGSSSDADINIDSTGLADIHAILEFDGKECKISIENAGRLVSVNGKLVKESREVREGDLIILSQLHIKMVGEKVEEEEDDNRTRIRMAMPKYILRGVSGTYFGKTYPLRGATTLGRHSECDICVNADGISRKHAQVAIEADGLSIVDLGSSNGTFVNGKAIKEESPLKVGDEIKLDNIRFLVQTPGMADDTTKKKAPPKPKNSVEQSETVNMKSSGGGLKWVITLLVLGGAVAAAWKMGYLNGIIS